jgi:hypothetical protein
MWSFLAKNFANLCTNQIFMSKFVLWENSHNLRNFAPAFWPQIAHTEMVVCRVSGPSKTGGSDHTCVNGKLRMAHTLMDRLLPQNSNYSSRHYSSSL